MVSRRVDHRGKPGYFLQHAADDVSIFFWDAPPVRPTSPTLRIAAKWRAQFVRDIGSEMLQLFKGFTEPHEQSVKHPSHVPKLVVRIVDGNPLIQSLSSDLLGFSRHMFKRIERLACNTIARKSATTKAAGIASRSSPMNSSRRS